MIEKAKAKSDGVLIVDAGNFAETKGFEPWEETEFIFDMMARVGIEVITPGDRELIKGVAEAKKLFGRQPDIDVVSANITDKNGKLLWEPYVVVEKAGVKLGVTGVTGASAYSFNLTRGLQEKDEFSFEDSREALRRVVPELRKQVDIVVVLLHETPGDARRMVDEIPGMDVVIVGHNPGYMFNPDRIANTLMVRGGNRGQYLSVLDLTIDQGMTVIDYNGEGKPLGKSVEKVESIEAVVTEFEAKRKVREDAAKRSEAVDKAMLQGTERFLGADTCQRCHAGVYTDWAETSHASAVLSHPADVPVTDGFEVEGVQCEHCHGLGTFHGTEAMVTQVSVNTCRSCHETEGMDPVVDYEAALANGFVH